MYDLIEVPRQGIPQLPQSGAQSERARGGHVEDRIQDQPGQLENGNQKLEIRWNK